MSIQTFGMAAFRRAVSRGIELAAQAEAYVRESSVLQIANPASLGIVCFRINPSGSDFSDDRLEQVNQAVQARVIESQVAMMSSTRLHGLYSLRLCILNHTTTWDDVRDTLDAIAKFGLEALSE
jgi:glutamate/tyrosine decarboxylase-like PLP-dependent enzyme